jgi:hypothetical protein
MKNSKLSWEETYKAMALSDEDWSAWECIEDGWKDLEMDEIPQLSIARADTLYSKCE